MRRAFFAFAVLLVTCAALADSPSVLIRVERQAQDDLVTLRTHDVPVIAELQTGLIVEAPASERDRLATLGYDAAILDPLAAASDYLVVPLGTRMTEDQLPSFGTTVLREGNLALVRVPKGSGVPAGVEIGSFAATWLNRDPLELPTSAPSVRPDSATDAPEPDPLVSQIVGLVDDAEIMQTWQDVTDNPPTGTRFSQSIGCEDAAHYCFDTYVGLGLEPEFDEWSTQDAPNVVAEVTGAVHPDRIYIVTGHLDDLPASGPAPGANDNASGSVTVLEAARTMACYAYRNTVRFLNVTGEEQGLHGSDHYAAEAKARGDDIRGVLNFDMNGWEGDGIPEVENLDVSYNSFSQWLGELYAESASTYDTGLSVDAFYCPSLTASDHASFWERGYPAIIGITDNQGYCGHGGTYPHYHESTDTIENSGDPTFFYATVRTAVATLAEMSEPFVITFDRSKYALDATVEIFVGDRERNTDPGSAETIDVTIKSDTESAGEVVTLTETGVDEKVFAGSIPVTTASPITGDGLLSVAQNDAIRATYVDALDCAGNADASYEARAIVDANGPLITGVNEEDITGSEATIVWTTDELADSEVVWGETVPPTISESDAALVTEHGIPLTGLAECTVYYYEVRSTDEAGNLAAADNGGKYFYFETLGDFGDGLQPCHAGQVTIEEDVSSCDGSVAFRVVDLDLNLDPGEVETATLEVTSTTESVPEIVTVTESGPNTSRFEGSIATGTGPAQTDGVLQTAHGDVVTVTYRDADDGTNRSSLSYATSEIDCAGPKISDVRVTSITDGRATVRFDTEEPGDTVVEWGTTPALGEVESALDLTTSHALVLDDLEGCSEVFFRVRSRDVFGHETAADDLGAPFRFASGEIPGLYWKDDFEAETTIWALGGEWEVGEPRGAGGSSGDPDPAEAYNERRVLGHDLSGQGAFEGDYEPGTNQQAQSPTLDASTWSNTKLLLYKHLQVGASDDASIWLWTGPGYPLYRSNGTTVRDREYEVMSFDVSGLVDGSPTVYLQFRQQADASGNYSGWNVDDVIFKDGSLPDYAQCGGCAAGPSFAGVASTEDPDACAASGVRLSWEAAVAWGSGGDGTYAIYRGTTPDFVVGPGSLVASGVTGLAYTDTMAPVDETLYYVVRAENDEACGSGPNNGGVTDDNAHAVAATDWTSRPTPVEIEGVAVELLGAAHVRVEWSGDPAATAYRVYRSTSPEPGGFSELARTGDLRHDDLGAGADQESYFYLVRGESACGIAGP